MAKKKKPTRRKNFWAELEAQDVRYHVANDWCCNFTDAHPGVNGQDECQLAAVSVPRRLDDPKYATNIVVRKD